jgi:hypothetical protein
MGTNQANVVDVPTVVFVSWPKITLSQLLSEKAHYHGSKSTCPAKDLLSFDECAMLNILNLEDRLLS